MTTYFTSDLHIGHRAVSWQREYGQWPTDRTLITPAMVTAHDDRLAANWDVAVCKDDVVWVLGDLTANDHELEYALDWIEARPGTKHLVLGNHDPAHPMHSDSHKWERKYHRAFETVGPSRSRKITLPGGTVERVLLSHFPYQGDRAEQRDRATQFRLRDEGMPLLHGHVHTRERVTRTAEDTPQIHVGTDAWDFHPVSLETVADLLSDALAYRFPVTVTRMAQ